MSFLTQAWLLDKYGVRITVPELAQILKVAPKTLQNRLALGKLPLKSYQDGIRYFNYSEVAEYLDSPKDQQ